MLIIRKETKYLFGLNKTDGKNTILVTYFLLVDLCNEFNVYLYCIMEREK